MGKNILDVGCGLGANLVHLFELGANSVTGLDISIDQALCTQEMMQVHHSELTNKLRFVAANAASMPFEDDFFDALVAADTFEHIDDLEFALAECVRVLKPGGFLYVYFPFYALWGAHMINWIRLPWCQVFFSEEVLLKVARKLESNNASINSQLPPETKLDLGSGNVIPFVSHLTVRRLEHAVKHIKNLAVIIKEDLLPPNWRTSAFSNRLLQPLNRIPVVQEMFTAKAVFVIQKQEKNRWESLMRSNFSKMLRKIYYTVLIDAVSYSGLSSTRKTVANWRFRIPRQCLFCSICPWRSKTINDHFNFNCWSTYFRCGLWLWSISYRLYRRFTRCFLCRFRC